MGDKTVGLVRGQDWLCLQLPSLPRKRRGSCGANLARRVVKHLLAPIEDKYHNLYMDNFYCDPHLSLELES